MFVWKKQKRAKTHELEKGDQCTFVAIAPPSRASIAYRTGKRDITNTDEFIQDLRQPVLGVPEISADGFKPYQVAVRDACRTSAFGIVSKTYSVTHLNGTAVIHRLL